MGGRRGAVTAVAFAILAALAVVGHRADSSPDDFLTSLKDRLSCRAYVMEARTSPDGAWVAERQNVDCSNGEAEPEEALSLRRPWEASAFRSRRSLMTGDEYPWLYQWIDGTTIEVGTNHAERFRQQDLARRVRFSFVALTPPACTAPASAAATVRRVQTLSKVTRNVAGLPNVGCELTLSDHAPRSPGTFISLEASKHFRTTGSLGGHTTTFPERTDARFYISQIEGHEQLENPVTCVTAGGLGDFTRSSLLFEFKRATGPNQAPEGWQMSRPLSEKDLRSLVAAIEAGSLDVDLFRWRYKNIERMSVVGSGTEPIQNFKSCLTDNRIFDPGAAH